MGRETHPSSGSRTVASLSHSADLGKTFLLEAHFAFSQSAWSLRVGYTGSHQNENTLDFLHNPPPHSSGVSAGNIHMDVH